MRAASLLAAAAAAAAVVACGASSTPVPAASSTAAKRATAFQPPQLSSTFDSSAGQLPEGIAITGDVAYVGLAPTGAILRVDLRTGAATPFAQLPKPVPNKGFMTGLATDSTGALYAALVSFTPEVQAGVYRVPAEGGNATLFAKDAAMPFPNGLAFDANDALYVTDSATGSVFRIGRDGHAERWASGDALVGNKDACGKGAGAPFDIGANGIVVDGDAVFVDNTDKGTLLRIAKGSDGKAGAPEVVVGPDCAALGGADGITRDANGDFLVAVNRQDKIVRVTAARTVETVFAAAPLDCPASFAWSGSTLYATNFALFRASAGKPATPGLIRLAGRN